MQQRVKQGAFYRIPKELFTEWRFRNLSAESKLMFGILFDRYSLSMMNNWKDEYGETFIYFTIEELMHLFSCSNRKAIKLLDELDDKRGVGLIRREKSGLGKPNKIYILGFKEMISGKGSEKRKSECDDIPPYL